MLKNQNSDQLFLKILFGPFLMKKLKNCTLFNISLQNLISTLCYVFQLDRKVPNNFLPHLDDGATILDVGVISESSWSARRLGASISLSKPCSLSSSRLLSSAAFIFLFFSWTFLSLKNSSLSISSNSEIITMLYGVNATIGNFNDFVQSNE
ncbi:hypothetical protein BpHYR1_048837 [Brachionus plicatilis]|uniref:Uncharacterized protein n=1 Tax=Brachionus plicatilis TaxID=10195 RepID=A0A3M7S637_BRAPC|nr:hypothetical protein BpHYR1_048837 [Brachionus plicatilis]